MSEPVQQNFYAVAHAPLVELFDMEQTEAVKSELERRAFDELQKAFALYQKVFADKAALQFTDHALALSNGSNGALITHKTR